MKYLDPKADLTFKKIFGEHPDLVMSLLNALLPLEDEQEIKDISYLSPERTPITEEGKDSIVDVYCTTSDGRQFIVEMQMYWSTNFMQRVLFNSSKVYVSQLKKGEPFERLQPVYSLNLIDDVFEPQMEEYYHYYRLVHDRDTKKVIDGFHLVFVELPKFKPQTMTQKKMRALWLRFLTEIDAYSNDIPQELLESPEINKAIGLVEESAFSREQLLGYDQFWDKVRRDKSLAIDLKRARKELQGTKEELQGTKEELQGTKEELQGAKEELQGAKDRLRDSALKLRAMGMPLDTIAQITGLSQEEIGTL